MVKSIFLNYDDDVKKGLDELKSDINSHRRRKLQLQELSWSDLFIEAVRDYAAHFGLSPKSLSQEEGDIEGGSLKYDE